MFRTIEGKVVIPSRCPSRSRLGFTLLELLVAAALLALGTVAVLEAITRTLTAARASYEQTQAVTLAEAKLTELRCRSDLQTGEEQGTFQAPYEQYRWQTDVRTAQEEGLVAARVNVYWKSGQQRREIMLESVLPQTESSVGMK